jgi:hypothetical protein
MHTDEHVYPVHHRRTHLCALSVVAESSDTLLPFKYTSEMVSTLRRGKGVIGESLRSPLKSSNAADMRRQCSSYPLSSNSTEGSLRRASEMLNCRVSTHIVSTAHLNSSSLYLYQEARRCRCGNALVWRP